MRMSSISKEPPFIFVTDWYIKCEIQMYLRYERMHDYDQYQYCQCGKQITIQKKLGPCGACSLFCFAATTEKPITEHFWLGALAKD